MWPPLFVGNSWRELLDVKAGSGASFPATGAGRPRAGPAGPPAAGIRSLEEPCGCDMLPISLMRLIYNVSQGVAPELSRSLPLSSDQTTRFPQLIVQVRI